MSASNEYAYWHLTPRGWRLGTSRLDFHLRETERPVPADRVKTVRYAEYMSSDFSPIDRTQEVEWVRDEAAAMALEAQFGPCPRAFSGPSD